jgi:hypothetical protein
MAGYPWFNPTGDGSCGVWPSHTVGYTVSFLLVKGTPMQKMQFGIWTTRFARKGIYSGKKWFWTVNQETSSSYNEEFIISVFIVTRLFQVHMPRVKTHAYWRLSAHLYRMRDYHSRKLWCSRLYAWLGRRIDIMGQNTITILRVQLKKYRA